MFDIVQCWTMLCVGIAECLILLIVGHCWVLDIDECWTLMSVGH